MKNLGYLPHRTSRSKKNFQALGGYFYYRTSLRERGSNSKTLIGAGTFIIEPVYVNVVVTVKHLLGRVLLL